MPNIFNADNGVVSGSAGIKLSSDTSGVLNIQTNGTTAISISASQVVSFPATSGFSFAGQVTFAAGTAAAPSISVTGDTNTGIYFPAADTIAFAEGGVEVARFDSSGNLGIGITTPAAGLQVANGNVRLTNGSAFTTGNALIREINAAAGSSNQFVTSSIGFRTDAFVDSGIITFSTASSASSPTERMRLDASGNLGLGVTPSAWSQGRALEVLNAGYGLWNGSGSPEASIYLTAGTVFNSGFKYSATSARASHYYQFQGAHVWSTAPAGTAGNAISFTQAMTLHASGGLSVGNTTDYGAKSINLGLAAGSVGSLVGALNFQGYTTGYGAGISSFIPAGSPGIDYQDLRFYTAAGPAAPNTERARITSGGDLLIGTTTSAFALAGRILTEINGSLSSLIALKTSDTARGYFAASTALTELAAVGASQPLLFTTNGAERARITSGGNLLVGTTNRVNSALLTVNNMGLSSYNGSGNSTINTIAVNAGSGGGMCVIAGVDFQSGASFSRLYLVAVRVSGGIASQTALIGSAGTGSASFSFAESGGFLTVTGSGFSGFGASWTAMFINT